MSRYWAMSLVVVSNGLLAPIVYAQSVQDRFEITPTDRKAIEIGVRSRLKDPDSAKFGFMAAIKDGDGARVCGVVNAKNSYGGYTGDVPFIADYSPRSHLAVLGVIGGTPDANYVAIKMCEPILGQKFK